MTTPEHIYRIKRKCYSLLTKIEAIPAGNPVSNKETIAGLKATIAAIDAYETMDGGATRHFLAEGMKAAWLEDLL